MGYTPQGGSSVPVYAPRLLPSVKWALVVPGNAPSAPAWSYDGTWPAPATTVTATANGVLTIDSGSPALGDRVVVMDQWNQYYQTFTVADLGSVSTPWVLTATADDIASSAWAVRITEGTVWAGGLAESANAGTDNWNGSTASGPFSTASAPFSTASGNDSTASGYESTASGNHSTASGDFSTASGNNYTASGNNSTASAPYSTASGNYSTAYADCQVADSGEDALGGQGSQMPLGATTSDATPKQLVNRNVGTHIFQDTSQAAVWNKTAQFQAFVTARRTDTPGTDSAWTITGVVRGDGTSTYTFIGGAPAPVLVAQDAGASTWAVAVSMSGNDFVITVTGEVANSITWGCVLKWQEVQG